ncbi:MAG: hypothetical protein JO102_02235, partial [Elusimicrobia bacterium]|nr:hypothetical protein [Elusimicrobiota bacterium]
PHGIAIALRNHLKKHGKLEADPEAGQPALVETRVEPPPSDDPALLELWNLSRAAEQCPKCFSSNVAYTAGCSGPTCQDCGHSECS